MKYVLNVLLGKESNQSVRVVFGNPNQFDAQIGVLMAWNEHEVMLKHILDKGLQSDLINVHEVREVMSKHILDKRSQSDLRKNLNEFDAGIGVLIAWKERGVTSKQIFAKGLRSDLRKNHEVRVKRVPEQVSQTDCPKEFDAQIGVFMACKEREVMSKHILDKRLQSDLRNVYEVRVKRVVAQDHEVTSEHILAEELRSDLKDIHEVRVTHVLEQNLNGFNARIGVLIAWKECEFIFKHILDEGLRLDLRNVHEVPVKRVHEHVSQTDRFALYLGIQMDLMLELDS
ncbi:hypothetical protein G2W53_026760 [Senna tora]|uniref:Uncharacterized protein n=1 Tax=Senna tora TaxID=362788 RepID=A0A834TI10_9FABA|nr:hypothetical protein G2W53_026760 [Senna tora]